MSIKRIVDTSFWTDDKVVENFSPEDKYFMLYLLTNPHTTQLGIYQVTPKVIGFEMGYSVDSVNVLLDRFENKYEMIKYCKTTKEVAIKNYLVYSIVKGGKPVEDLLNKEIKQVKSKQLIKYVFGNIVDNDNINITVKNIINKYNDNVNDNDNDNDNDVSYHDSYHDSLNVASEVTTIFDFWNKQQIQVHKEITPKIEKSIKNALKKYSMEDIKSAILHYAQAYHDKKYFFDYQWSLVTFLNQGNCLPDFLDNGSKWVNYDKEMGAKNLRRGYEYGKDYSIYDR